jgi:hypothetical protein
MTATTTKTRDNNRIVRARFNSDLGRPQTRASVRALQWEKEFSSQQKRPFSTPTQENWNIEMMLDATFTARLRLIGLRHPNSFAPPVHRGRIAQAQRANP